jgi:hypothetical protein
MDVQSKSEVDLEEMLIDLMTQRVTGNISPGEYKAKAEPILTEYHKRLYGKKKRSSDAYDRAMRGI